MKNEKSLYDLAWNYIKGSEVTNSELEALDGMIDAHDPDWSGSRTGSYVLKVEEAAKAFGKRIASIVKIEDTRDYIEEGDRWIALAGTGDERECDRCGRIHEVHATVELIDGSQAVVGTGCMKGDTFEKELRNGASKAKTTRRLECELAAMEARLPVIEELRAKVAAMEAPEITEETTGERLVLRMGDACQWVLNGREPYHAAQLEKSWRWNRARDAGITSRDEYINLSIKDMKKKIAKRS